MTVIFELLLVVENKEFLIPAVPRLSRHWKWIKHQPTHIIITPHAPTSLATRSITLVHPTITQDTCHIIHAISSILPCCRAIKPAVIMLRIMNTTVYFLRDINAYIQTELDHTVLDPFERSPFTPAFQNNVLITRPRHASNTGWVILHLSYLDQLSVMMEIPKDIKWAKLSLPTPLDLSWETCHGRGCYIWSLDLSHSYQQLHTCPLD